MNQPLTDMLQKYGVELLYTQPTFDLLVICGGKHLKAVSDWPGTKVRAAGRWQSQQVLALGGAPTAIDPGEQYLALQNKTVDCALSVPTLVLSLKLYEVAPKLTSLRQAVNTSLLVMNPRSWRSISAEDQAAIRAVSTETRHRAIVQMRSIADKGMADLKTLGSDIYTLNDAELIAMKDKMRPVFDKIGEGRRRRQAIRGSAQAVLVSQTVVPQGNAQTTTAHMTNGRSWIDVAETFTRAVNRMFAFIACVLVMVIVLVVVREVVLRYAFNEPSTWALDVARYLLLFTFSLLAPARERITCMSTCSTTGSAGLAPLAAHLGWVLVVFFGAVLFWYVLEVTIDVFETDEFSFSSSIRLKHLYWIGPVGTCNSFDGLRAARPIWTEPPAAAADTAWRGRQRVATGQRCSRFSDPRLHPCAHSAMITRTPVAVALGTIGILGTAIFVSPDALRQLGNIAFTQSSNFVLVVVPLFVLMGEALAATGIGNDLFRAAHMWLRRLPGALAVATVFACAVFAAVCELESGDGRDHRLDGGARNDQARL